MADVAITTVQMTANTSGVLKYSGEAFSEGDTLYLAADGKYYKAIANDTQLKAATTAVAGKTATAAGQLVPLITGGEFDVDATLVAGTVYAQSATSGQIAPIVDLTTGDWVTIIGVAMDANTLKAIFGAQGFQL